MSVTTWKEKGLLVLDADGKIDEAATNARLDERPEDYRGGKSHRKATDVQPPVEEPAAGAIVEYIATMAERNADLDKTLSTRFARYERSEY